MAILGLRMMVERLYLDQAAGRGRCLVATHHRVQSPAELAALDKHQRCTTEAH